MRSPVDHPERPPAGAQPADPAVVTEPTDRGHVGSRSTRRTLRAALGTMVAASAAPYGYTISIWSSGAVLMHAHGTPDVADVFAFIAGALAGFGLMALLALGAPANMQSVDQAGDRVLAGALHWLAVGGAVGAVALLSELDGWEAWALGSFAATSIYILGASLQLAAVTARRSKPARG